ncbi:sporulation histidine kinase inhibitor Sda [Aquibacillus albus]|uniref:Lhr-like helicase n=1 Tax=Aquibacillus albus TaxID=1168171 RepID=A0ABS2MXX1_9BACI|nr:sporulation histidine kinase inhibitor Sda [Aquibacillus albus]MBM7570715.1 Lhr-like helicase [Aquibacillus albus]
MHSLSNELLVEAYREAKQKKMDVDFINLLKKEIERRGIDFEVVNGDV